MDEEEREREPREQKSERGRAGIAIFEVCSRDKKIRVLTDIRYNIEDRKYGGILS